MIEIHKDLLLLIIGVPLVLLFITSIFTDFYEKDGQPTGPWPGALYLIALVTGTILTLCALGHGFLVGIGVLT